MSNNAKSAKVAQILTRLLYYAICYRVLCVSWLWWPCSILIFTAVTAFLSIAHRTLYSRLRALLEACPAARCLEKTHSAGTFPGFTRLCSTQRPNLLEKRLQNPVSARTGSYTEPYTDISCRWWFSSTTGTEPLTCPASGDAPGNLFAYNHSRGYPVCLVQSGFP